MGDSLLEVRIDEDAFIALSEYVKWCYRLAYGSKLQMGFLGFRWVGGRRPQVCNYKWVNRFHRF